MQVLSLGTGSVKRLPSDLADETMPLALVEDRARPGVRTDVTRVAKAILEDPPDAATFIAQVMISPEPAALGPVVRLSPLLMPVKGTDGWHLPAGFSVPEFEALLALGLDALAPEEVERIAHLGRAWIAGHCPNQPIRQRLGMTPDPGDATFAEGLQRWRALTAT
jgi:uncharacterized protein